MADAEAPSTVTDAVQRLHDEGFDEDYVIRDGALVRRDDDGTWSEIGDAVIERMYRFEGPSDPGDEMIVLGVRSADGGRRGVVAAGYGMGADLETVEVLDALIDRRRGQPPD